MPGIVGARSAATGVTPATGDYTRKVIENGMSYKPGSGRRASSRLQEEPCLAVLGIMKAHSDTSCSPHLVEPRTSVRFRHQSSIESVILIRGYCISDCSDHFNCNPGLLSNPRNSISSVFILNRYLGGSMNAPNTGIYLFSISYHAACDST